MSELEKFFRPHTEKPETEDGVFSQTEVGLANRNHGFLLETLKLDVTPTGAHYLLNHFDVPLLDADSHVLAFSGAFETPFELSVNEIRISRRLPCRSPWNAPAMPGGRVSTLFFNAMDV